MKKIVMLCFAAISISATQAQIRVGIQAGAALSRTSFEFVDDVNSVTTISGNSLHTGYKVGIIVSKKINPKVSFAPELNLVKKGARFAYPDQTVYYPTNPGYYRAKVSNMFGELNLNLSFGAQGKEGLFAGFGPTISYGFSGKVKDNFENINTTVTTNVKFDGKDNTTDNNFHLKALEFGGNAFAGYQGPSGLFIKGFVHLSGSNLAVADREKFRTNYFGLAIGAMFKGK
ncbi:MAG: outer membrane beta-barrel protein [Dinghuibacter sp.]|nr:outer membrane beta-barrel protein [Dinghuibacter sp.]